jgi:DNA-binding beta-propeller fold protein YncE
MNLRLFLFLLFLFCFQFTYSQTINDLLSEKEVKSGMSRFYNRQYEAAVQLFNKALSFQPMNFRARYYLGQAYLNSGYAKNALDEWENLIRLGSGSYQVKQKLNDLYFRLSIDKHYDYSNPYLFTKIYDGVRDGMHKIIRPSFIVYDPEYDSLLVSSQQAKFIVEVDGSGKVIREIGRKWGDISSFKMPTGLFIYDNKIYVGDYALDSVFIFTREGKFLKKFGVKGFAASNISGPMGIAVTSDEYIFVVDNGNDRVQKFNLQGEWIQSIGEGDLNRPTDITGKDNTIYVSDTANKRVLSYDTFGNRLEKIGEGTLEEPRGLCLKDSKLYIVDAKKGLFIYDIQNRSLEKFDLDEGKLDYPFDVCLDDKNLLYETDFNTQNMAIFTPLQLKYVNLGLETSQIWFSDYPNNLIHIRAWDKMGKPLYNLKEDNFQLFEEGVEIPIIRLGATYNYRENLYVKVILDKSEAMREYDPELIESITAFLQKATGDDWLDFILMGDKMESSGKKQAALLWPINYIRKNAYSGNYPQEMDKAIHQAIQELLNVNRNKAIVLFMSGELGDNSFKNYEIDTLSTFAKQNAIPIYVVNFTDKNHGFFSKIAEETFGKYYTIQDIKDILNIYKQIKESKPLEYILSYEGLNLKGIKNYWVNVHIKVKYKDLVGVDDTGYYVPQMESKPSFGSGSSH